MKDSGLLLNLVAQRKSFLHWSENALHLENLVAHADLAVGGGAIEIEPLQVEGGKLDLRVRFRFSRKHKMANVDVRWGKLATGIALRDGKRDWKILAPHRTGSRDGRGGRRSRVMPQARRPSCKPLASESRRRKLRCDPITEFHVQRTDLRCPPVSTREQSRKGRCFREDEEPWKSIHRQRENDPLYLAVAV